MNSIFLNAFLSCESFRIPDPQTHEVGVEFRGAAKSVQKLSTDQEFGHSCTFPKNTRCIFIFLCKWHIATHTFTYAYVCKYRKKVPHVRLFWLWDALAFIINGSALTPQNIKILILQKFPKNVQFPSPPRPLRIPLIRTHSTRGPSNGPATPPSLDRMESDCLFVFSPISVSCYD